MHLALGYACSFIKNVYLLFRHPHVKQHSRVLDELVNPGFQIASAVSQCCLFSLDVISPTELFIAEHSTWLKAILRTLFGLVDSFYVGYENLKPVSQKIQYLHPDNHNTQTFDIRISGQHDLKLLVPMTNFINTQQYSV